MSTVKSIDDLDAVFAKVKEMAPDIYPVDTVNSENILMVMADLDDINRSSDLCMGMDIFGDVKSGNGMKKVMSLRILQRMRVLCSGMKDRFSAVLPA